MPKNSFEKPQNIPTEQEVFKEEDLELERRTEEEEIDKEILTPEQKKEIEEEIKFIEKSLEKEGEMLNEAYFNNQDKEGFISRLRKKIKGLAIASTLLALCSLGKPEQAGGFQLESLSRVLQIKGPKIEGYFNGKKIFNLAWEEPRSKVKQQKKEIKKESQIERVGPYDRIKVSLEDLEKYPPQMRVIIVNKTGWPVEIDDFVSRQVGKFKFKNKPVYLPAALGGKKQIIPFRACMVFGSPGEYKFAVRAYKKIVPQVKRNYIPTPQGYIIEEKVSYKPKGFYGDRILIIRLTGQTRKVEVLVKDKKGRISKKEIEVGAYGEITQFTKSPLGIKRFSFKREGPFIVERDLGFLRRKRHIRDRYGREWIIEEDIEIIAD